MDQKVLAARISVASNVLLVVVKLVVGAAIGSVSVMSEAIHSAVDLLAAVIALLSVRVSSRPADRNHAYGHGKVENLSALVEGALIVAAAGWIVVEALGKLRSAETAHMLAPGMAVMVLSAGLNWLVSANLFRVARKHDSMALEADALHLRTDVWTSLGVFVGLGLAQVTGFRWLDPVAALAVAALITRAGLQLCAEALRPLVDARLPADEEAEIIGLIERFRARYVEFHDLRTRRSGAVRHVDFHLVVPGDRPLQEVHQVCDQIEEAIRERYPLAHVLIHPEPLP
ncbi:MAG TPA: cation diffusion facilitator family transporter [Symbiobacteriaceae bacterium]|nr:cation diffusion facilitator family transporter [Symbiobacteriaceae bacterium]